MNDKEWEALSEEERQILQERGRKNLQEGIRLANKAFLREIEQIANDDTLPSLSPEEEERLKAKIHEIIEDYYRKKEQKKRQNKNE